MKGDISFQAPLVIADKRESGASALVLQQAAGDCGELTLQTCLLPDRDEPYLLSLELARHRLMILYSKLEDWGMFELPADHPVIKRADLSRKLLIEALCFQGDDATRADRLAKDALVAAIDGGEELALAHAELLLNRRKSAGALPRHPVGVGSRLDQGHERVRAAVLANFDFIALPTPWKTIAPEEGDYRWQALDQWAEWAGRNRLPVVAGPLVSFDPSCLPEWMFIWEHDYDTVRDMIYEHVERVVTRYRNVFATWNVVSGLNVNNHFAFSLDQLMDLSRMATMLVKKIQPSAKGHVEICQPWGEYYAVNQRAVPPMMYADLLIQGAMNFDAFSIKLLMGQAVPGQYTRDLMQISGLLDHFAVHGKPLHVTVAAPSEPVTSMMIATPNADQPADANCGYWRKPWSPVVQAHWLEAVLQIAMSKPFVESVTWHEFMDHPEIELPLGGLLTEEMQPKASFRRMASFRKNVLGLSAGAAQAARMAAPAPAAAGPAPSSGAA